MNVRVFFLEKQIHSVCQRRSELAQLDAAAGLGGRLVWAFPRYQRALLVI